MKTNNTSPVKRNTIQRELVLHSVQQLRSHPTPETVYQHIHASHPRISRGTVYRNLGVLEEEGMIGRVAIPNGADRMDFRVEPHYHLQCLDCGQVFDIQLPYLQQYASAFEDEQGFLILGHQMMFSGYCKRCKEKHESVVCKPEESKDECEDEPVCKVLNDCHGS